jgi:ligand-binding SRPBCC domain-containing protein
MPIIRLTTQIRAPRERYFDLARSVALHLCAAGDTGERVIAGRRSGLFECDDEVEWEAVHFGVRQRLRVRITAMRSPEYFVDEMVCGAFRSMRHEHWFTQKDDVCVMEDVFCFRSPLGVIGTMFDAVILAPYMRRFLQRRNQHIRDIAESGDWEALMY